MLTLSEGKGSAPFGAGPLFVDKAGRGDACSARDEGVQQPNMAATETNGTRRVAMMTAPQGIKGRNLAARLLRLGRRGVLAVTLMVQIAEDEEEGDEDDGLDGGDEGKVVGKMAVILLDGEDQDGDEEDGQAQGHHDIFGEFAHFFYHELANYFFEHELSGIDHEFIRNYFLSRIGELEVYFFITN